MSASDEHEYELGQLDVDLDVAERHTGSDDDRAERRWMIWGAVGAVVVTTGFLGALALGSHGEVQRAKPAVGAASRVASAVAAHAAVAQAPVPEGVAPEAKPKLARGNVRSKATTLSATRPEPSTPRVAPAAPAGKKAPVAPAPKSARGSAAKTKSEPDPLSGLPNVADEPEDAAGTPEPAADAPTDFTHDANPFATEDEGEGEGEDADPADGPESADPADGPERDDAKSDGAEVPAKPDASALTAASELPTEPPSPEQF